MIKVQILRETTCMFIIHMIYRLSEINKLDCARQIWNQLGQSVFQRYIYILYTVWLSMSAAVAHVWDYTTHQHRRQVTLEWWQIFMCMEMLFNLIQTSNSWLMTIVAKNHKYIYMYIYIYGETLYMTYIIFKDF